MRLNKLIYCLLFATQTFK